MEMYRKPCYSTFKRLSDKNIYGVATLLNNLDDVFRKSLVSSNLLNKIGGSFLNTRCGRLTDEKNEVFNWRSRRA
jgi:hypothetical protein